jgi:hypothetical protein
VVTVPSGFTIVPLGGAGYVVEPAGGGVYAGFEEFNPVGLLVVPGAVGYTGLGVAR